MSVRSAARTVLSITHLKRWSATIIANVVSTYALDTVCTAAGVLLVASGVFAGIETHAAIVLLGISYVMWGGGLSSSLAANWRLLETTGTSTSLLSKLAYDPAEAADRSGRLASNPNCRRVCGLRTGERIAVLSWRLRASLRQRRGLQRRGARFPRRRQCRCFRLRIRAGLVDPHPSWAREGRGVCFVRRRVGASGLPRGLLPRRRCRRATYDRLHHRSRTTDAGRRTSACLRRRTDAPSCLPDCQVRFRDPPRRLSSIQS